MAVALIGRPPESPNPLEETLSAIGTTALRPSQGDKSMKIPNKVKHKGRLEYKNTQAHMAVACKFVESQKHFPYNILSN